MQIRIFALCALASVPMLGMLAPARAAQTPTHAGAPVVQCSATLYHFFPGQVDYCLGQKNWQEGNYDAGLQMFKKAAGWASKPAQYALGLIYYNGHHVQVNRPLGIAWLWLAAERHSAHNTEVADSAIKLASPAEIEQANQYLVQLRPLYADAHTAHRAKEHYDRAMRGMHPDPVYGTPTCIPGTTGRVFAGGGNHGPTIATPMPGGLVNVGPLGKFAGKVKQPGKNKHRGVKRGMFPGMNCASTVAVKQHLNVIATQYFDGLFGHVSVGPLHSVPAQAKP